MQHHRHRHQRHDDHNIQQHQHNHDEINENKKSSNIFQALEAQDEEEGSQSLPLSSCTTSSSKVMSSNERQNVSISSQASTKDRNKLLAKLHAERQAREKERPLMTSTTSTLAPLSWSTNATSPTVSTSNTSKEDKKLEAKKMEEMSDMEFMDAYRQQNAKVEISHSDAYKAYVYGWNRPTNMDRKETRDKFKATMNEAADKRKKKVHREGSENGSSNNGKGKKNNKKKQ